MADFNEKGLHEKDGYNGNLESGRRGSVTVDGRRMSRIGPAPRGSIVDANMGEEHGRLVQQEAGNAIQYRTCSWQKVHDSTWSSIDHRLTTIRLLRYSSQSISAWPLCPFHIPTRCLDLSLG